LKKQITQEELKSQLHYDPENGHFTWLLNKGFVHKGDRAGWTTEKGYIKITVLGSQYFAHRLAFLYMEGAFPPHQVDHIYHNRSHNVWKNLRHATGTMNQRNSSGRKNNTSGYCGVHFHRDTKKWEARIKLQGKYQYLGSYKNVEDAARARKEAEIKFGFHPHHGNTHPY
jgi:hypothetical protein